MTRLRSIDSLHATTLRPSVQGWVLSHLIDWVEKQGINSTSIRSLPGLADLRDPDLRVPEASVEAAWRLGTTLTHDEALGVHLAMWLRSSSEGALVQCWVLQGGSGGGAWATLATASWRLLPDPGHSRPQASNVGALVTGYASEHSHADLVAPIHRIERFLGTQLDAPRGRSII